MQANALLKPQKVKAREPRLLFVDIEWQAVKAYVWRAWDENISPAQIIEDGGMLCICMKFSDEKSFRFHAAWEDGDKFLMLQETRKAILEADAVVTYNGDKYDIPKISGELLRHNMEPLPPVTSIDLIKTVKKQGYFRNALGFVGPFLGLGSKVEHEGFALWKKVDEGDERARKKMRKYCIQDVRLLENLYYRIKPFIKNHPSLGDQPGGSCGSCGSTHLQSRGYRRTKYFRIQRMHCQDCGSWFDGARNKVTS